MGVRRNQSFSGCCETDVAGRIRRRYVQQHGVFSIITQDDWQTKETTTGKVLVAEEVQQQR